MKIVIICPVRSGTPEEAESYVEVLEDLGHSVHFPPRDNPQSDPSGYEICETMRKAIQAADRVDIWYSPDSQGVHFDLGMAFSMHKRLKLLNAPEDFEGKSYVKVIRNCQ